MKKVTVRQLAAATALLFTLGVAMASAQDGRHGHGKMGKMGGHGFGMRGLSKLDLTESQKADVKRIMESRQATFEALHERSRANWQALHELSEGFVARQRRGRCRVLKPSGPGSPSRRAEERMEEIPPSSPPSRRKSSTR